MGNCYILFSSVSAVNCGQIKVMFLKNKCSVGFDIILVDIRGNISTLQIDKVYTTSIKTQCAVCIFVLMIFIYL